MAANGALRGLQLRGGPGELRDYRQPADSARVLRAAAAACGRHADGLPARRADRVSSGPVRYARTAEGGAAPGDAQPGHAGRAHEARRRHTGARARNAGGVEHVPGRIEIADGPEPLVGRRYDHVPVPEKPTDSAPRGWRRALHQWLVGAESSPDASAASGVPPEPSPARIGHYAIVRKIGEGGMGVVYAARDERLQRTVALKTMASPGDGETARKRFWREARAAASVNHPNICQIHELGEDAGTLFIAM